MAEKSARRVSVVSDASSWDDQSEGSADELFGTLCQKFSVLDLTGQGSLRRNDVADVLRKVFDWPEADVAELLDGYCLEISDEKEINVEEFFAWLVEETPDATMTATFSQVSQRGKVRNRSDVSEYERKGSKAGVSLQRDSVISAYTEDGCCSNDQSMEALSCNFLQTTFTDEVRAAGFDEQATVSDIAQDVIRSKGQHQICPRDDDVGAAYVDCVGDELDVVSNATHMLSYTWGYRVSAIVETLASYCVKQDLNPKRFYVWICCLCVNQHRVSSDHPLPFEFFESAFRQRVEGIGHVLAMMSPWKEPGYIKRVWTCFELYTAVSSKDTVKLDIIMPPSESDDLHKCIVQPDGLDPIWKALKSLKLEKAEAFSPVDKENIFKLIKKGPGFAVLNRIVSDHIRDWMISAVQEQVERVFLAFTSPYSSSYMSWDDVNAVGEALGDLLRRFGFVSRAQETYARAIALAPESLRTTQNYAKLLKKEGSSIMSQGDAAGALERYNQALVIYEAMNEGSSKGVASLWNYIASAKEKIGDFDAAIDANERSKQILSDLGQLHTGGGAYMLREYGDMLLKIHELDAANVQFEQAAAIYKMKGKDGTPDYAYLLNSQALMAMQAGDKEGALQKYGDAEDIHRNMGTLGTNGGLALLYNLGKARLSIGDLLGAQSAFLEAKTLTDASGTAAAKDIDVTHLLEEFIEGATPGGGLGPVMSRYASTRSLGGEATGRQASIGDPDVPVAINADALQAAKQRRTVQGASIRHKLLQEIPEGNDVQTGAPPVAAGAVQEQPDVNLEVSEVKVSDPTTQDL